MLKAGLLAGVLIFLILPAPAATRLTIKEAEETALRSHPQLLAVRSQAEAVAQIPNQVRARFYPQSSGALTGALAEDNNTRIMAGGINNPIIYNRVGAGFNVSQMVTDFGRTQHLTESAQYRALSAGEAAKVTRADVLLRVDRAYYAALRAQALLGVAQQTVNARQLVVDQTTTLAANKLKSELDVTFTRVNLEEARLFQSNAVNEARSAMVDLSNAMGLPDTQDYELVEEPVPADLPAEWTSFVQEAAKNRPELQQVRFDEQAAAEAVKAERAAMFPTISGFISAGVVPFHVDRLQNHWSAGGVNVDLPILNGGLFKARRAEAEARQRAASQISRDVNQRVLRDVRLAYIAAQNAQERLQLTASLLAQAQQSLSLAQARYDLGLSSIIELTQAQLNLTRAQIAQASARFEYQAQRAILEYQKGTL
jgi:outer membrane protein